MDLQLSWLELSAQSYLRRGDIIYKQIPNFPNYIINENGEDILKLCDTRLYTVIENTMWRRKSTTNKFVQLCDNNYTIYNNNVYRIVKLWDNGRGILS